MSAQGRPLQTGEKICVIGSGNIGTLLSAELAAGGNRVALYTSHPEKFDGSIEVLDREGVSLFTATGILGTASLAEALEGASLVMITYPSFLMPSLSRAMLPYTRAGQTLLCIPGGGGEFAFSEHLQKGCVLAGLQRVHSIARLKEYGKSVFMLGRKEEVQLSAIPGDKAGMLAERLGGLLKMPCRVLANYLVLTLTPSNPILHTARLYSMFRDYRPGGSFDHNILFYEEWTDDASRWMLAGDDELQRLCRRLEQYRLSMREVRPLREHYESDTPEKMTAKISGIPAFRGLTSPMKETEPGSGRWVPDFSSRYFTADFSFGLKTILEIAAVFGTQTPALREIYRWYEELLSACGQRPPACFTLPAALTSPEALAGFYLAGDRVEENFV